MVHHFTQKINQSPAPESQPESQLSRATPDTNCLGLGFPSKAEPETDLLGSKREEPEGKKQRKEKSKCYRVRHYLEQPELNPGPSGEAYRM